MKIVNKTKQVTLATDAFEAMSFASKSLGLLDLNKPRSMIIQTRFGIHTFGLKERIDVLVLNKVNKVVSIKHSMHPSRIFTWNIKHSIVIELPGGKLLETRTEKGDEIEMR